MLALKRYPWRKRSAKAREWARRSHAPDSLRSQRRAEHGPDYATLLWRAKEDRRGTIIRTGDLYRGDGRVQAWCVRHSIAGRSDQFDILLGGQLLRTGSRRLIARLLPGIRLL